MIELGSVKGFEEYSKYFVTKCGKVYTTKYGELSEMSQQDCTNSSGDLYKRVGLSANGHRKTFRVHRLVLLCYDFVENHEELTGHHRDEDTLNNHIDNLTWETLGDNIRLSQAGSTKFEDPNKVAREYLVGNTTLQQLSDKYGVSLETIWRTVNVYSTIPNTKKRKTFNNLDKKLIAKYYLESPKRTLKETAKTFNCSQSLVSLSVKLYNRGDLNEVS